MAGLAGATLPRRLGARRERAAGSNSCSRRRCRGARWVVRERPRGHGRDRRLRARARGHRDRGRRASRAATSAHPVARHARPRPVRGRGFAGIGFAVGGLVRSSLAAPVAAVVVIVTFVRSTRWAPPSSCRTRSSTCRSTSTSRPADGRARTTSSASRSSASRRCWGFGGLLSRRVGPAAEGRRAGNVRAWTRSSSRWSRSAPSCTSPGTSGSRPPATRCGRRRSGCSRRPSASCPAGIAAWWFAAGRPCRSRAIALGVVSGVIEAGYFVLLSAAYRRGDLSVVYPIARGTAPLLAVAIGVGLLGRAPRRRRLARRRGTARGVPAAPAAVAGAAAATAASTRAIAFALATGVTIADLLGRRSRRDAAHRPAALRRDPVGDRRRRARRVDPARGRRRGCSPVVATQVRRAAIGGWLTLGGLPADPVALSVAPLSAVAPLRESAAVFAAAWGSVRLGEAVGRGRRVRRVGRVDA